MVIWKEQLNFKIWGLIIWAKSLLKIPIVAIGGINYENAKILVKMGVDVIAVVSAVFSDDVYSNSKKISSIFDVPGRT